MKKKKKTENIPGILSKTIVPIFNRCVIFDTSMNSWHGVQQITKRKNLYRRSIQIYYFVKENSIKRKRFKVLYAPDDKQKKNKKVLNFIKIRSSNKIFQ